MVLMYAVLLNLARMLVLYSPKGRAKTPEAVNKEFSSTKKKVSTPGSGNNPISSITFTSGKTNVYVSLKCSRDIPDFQPRLMRSDTPDEPNSYVVVCTIDSEIKKKNNTYTFKLPRIDTSRPERAYCIQFDENDKVHSSEAFKYSDDENSYILYREYKTKTNKATWWILGLVIVILVLVVLLFLSRIFF